MTGNLPQRKISESRHQKAVGEIDDHGFGQWTSDTNKNSRQATTTSSDPSEELPPPSLRQHQIHHDRIDGTFSNETETYCGVLRPYSNIIGANGQSAGRAVSTPWGDALRLLLVKGFGGKLFRRPRMWRYTLLTTGNLRRKTIRLKWRVS